MRYLAFLFVLVMIISFFDAWCAAKRSLIPRNVDGTVTHRELRHEKHPGSDDVCLLQLSDRGWIHVDPTIYSRVSVGDNLEKAFGSGTLMINGKSHELEWSQDVYGMLYALPVTMAVAVVLGVMATIETTGWARDKKLQLNGE